MRLSTAAMEKRDGEPKTSSANRRGPLKIHTVVRCPYQGDIEEEKYKGWVMTNENEKGEVDVLHFNDGVTKQPDWSRNVPVSMLEEVYGALDGPPTADQIAGISPKDKKKAKEAASTQEQGSEEENDEEVAEKSVKTILTDDEAARLTDSFLRGDMDIELSEEHKRAMVDGRVSPDNLDPQYEASMEGPGAANISLAQEFDDEFHTFSYKQLQFIAGKLAIKKAGSKFQLQERVRRHFRNRYGGGVCDPTTGAPVGGVSQAQPKPVEEDSEKAPLEVKDTTPKENPKDKSGSSQKIDVSAPPAPCVSVLPTIA